MALPTHIALAVRSHVDARYFFIALGVGSMTLAAECAGDRFRRPAGERRDLMLLAGLMATRTRQRGVMRHRLGPGDLTVARTAFLRSMRGFRSVGIVAANTGLQRVVSHRIDLRKAGRAGRIVAVAQRASGALPGGDKMNLHRRLDVSCRRSMAHLASHAVVPFGVVHLNDFVVAGGALLVPGVLQGKPGNFIHCRGPIMPELTEGLRNQKLPSQYEPQNQQAKDNRQTCNLLRHHHPCRPGEIGPRDLPPIGPRLAHAGSTSTRIRKHTIPYFDVDFVNTGCGVFLPPSQPERRCGTQEPGNVADIGERKPGTAVKKTAAWSWGEKDGYAGISLSNRLSMNSVEIDGSRTRTRAGTDRPRSLAGSTQHPRFKRRDKAGATGAGRSTRIPASCAKASTPLQRWRNLHQFTSCKLFSVDTSTRTETPLIGAASAVSRSVFLDAPDVRRLPHRSPLAG